MVYGLVLKLLLEPFVSAWNWIKSVFVGHSPSKLGMGIVHGIMSVGAMIFDALTSPFRAFLGWVVDKIPGMGKIAAGIKGGMSGAIEHKVTTSGLVSTNIQPVDTKINNGTNETKQQSQIKNDVKETKYSLDDIYNVIKTLNDNLLAGNVKAGDVYLDSSLVSSVMARGIEFKGSHGTNR